MFDQIATMITKTLFIMKETEKLLFFACKLLKMYIGEGHLDNMACICQILGEFFGHNQKHTYSQLFLKTALQYAIVFNDIAVG